MIHAYAPIWRCLMYDIIIEIREKAYVHVHHLEIITEANGMKRSQIKWKLLLFDELDFFFF